MTNYLLHRQSGAVQVVQNDRECFYFILGDSWLRSSVGVCLNSYHFNKILIELSGVMCNVDFTSPLNFRDILWGVAGGREKQSSWFLQQPEQLLPPVAKSVEIASLCPMPRPREKPRKFKGRVNVVHRM